MEQRWLHWCCAGVLVLALVSHSPHSWATACTCMPEHPQAHYCKADFAIVARVQRLLKDRSNLDGPNVYKVKIRKAFKMSPKARVALESGRILTAPSDGMCGVQFRPRQTYLITGRIFSLEAHVSSCNMVDQWSRITPRQRKGFRLLYKLGCSCKVHLNFGPRRTTARPLMRHVCQSTWGDCYQRHGICLINKEGFCNWTRAKMLTRCLDSYQHNRTVT